MENGRVAAATPGDISRLDDDTITPRPLESGSDDSLRHRGVSKSTANRPGLAQHASASSEAGTAFAKLPTDVIELYVFLDPQLLKPPVLTEA